MAHLFAPRPLNPELPIFFNVDGVVGAGPAANKREDVLLVQFAFKVAAGSAHQRISHDERAAFGAVNVTGVVDAATINAIRAEQNDQRRTHGTGVVDGRVSPAKGGTHYAGSAWSISRLNNNMQDIYCDIWPRIDKIPGCPSELIQMVVREVVGI